MAEVGGSRPLRFRTTPLSQLLVLSILWACATVQAVPNTLDTSALVFLPAAGAGIADRRGRFREILCAVNEGHGHQAVYLFGRRDRFAAHFTPTVVSAWSHPGLRSLA
ncbi:MAG TPA: hypothetical protein VLE23_17430 [Geminicoccaceae bacterium]|nr:hypothetical protein [Geminicoccaceae bacterium]